ncbi:hypothetical protein [Demequina aestuarii]|uniref:hypothetical protein n=1 Tax=Demequina aestuarii TaxID=327095 RepID=UPI000785B079|nr:hypothetical protein [Demequina aestuarii]
MFGWDVDTSFAEADLWRRSHAVLCDVDFGVERRRVLYLRSLRKGLRQAASVLDTADEVHLWWVDSFDGVEQLECSRLTITHDFSSLDLGPLSRLPARVTALTLSGPGPRGWFQPLAHPGLASLTIDADSLSPDAQRGDGLRALTLTEYRQRNLAGLSWAQGVTRLELLEATRLVGVHEISGWTELRSLTVSAARGLSSAELEELPAGLSELWLHGLPRMGSVDFVRKFRGLTCLWLEDCGPIDSLAPLAGMVSVERVGAIGSTNIKDGDLAVLNDLPSLRQVALARRRHYVPPASSFDHMAEAPEPRSHDDSL